MMAFGKFADGAAMFSTTPVENLFILEFMSSAPGDFVRVYLYGLMICHHPQLSDGIEGVAKALNLDMDTVLNACRYWEREGLVVRLSDNPPTFEFHSCQEAMNARPQIEKEYYRNRDFTAALQSLFGNEILHPKEYTMASDWVEVMHLPQEVVLCMVRHELAKTTKRRTLQTIFKHLDQTALVLADREIYTVEAAERYFAFDEAANRCAAAVLKKFNYRRKPSEPEENLAKKWLHEWNFTQDAVLEACEKTVNSQNPSFNYLDAILEGMRSEDGSVTDAQILRARAEAEDDAFQRIKAVYAGMGITGRVPNEDDRQMLEGFLQLGFEYDVVLRATRGLKNRTMEGLKNRLIGWAERGMFTMSALEQEIQQTEMMRAQIRPLFDRAGIDRAITGADRQLMEKWQQQHSMQMILLAGELSRGTDTPMRYIDATLARWQQDGVTTPEAAEKQRPAVKPGTPREAGNFSQREYKKEDFASGFFVEFDPDEEEGE